MTDEAGLFAPWRFADAIERIAVRRAGSAREPSMQAHGVSLATIRENRDRFARLLVRDLRAGRLEAEPGRVYTIERDGKQRRLFDFPLIELIVHDAVAHWLAGRVEGALSARLYSYRPGVAWHRALRDFAGYVRAAAGGCHGAARAPGLYVLRRDVRSYFDTIPVTDDAPLWRIIARSVGDPGDAAATWSLIRRTLCPPLRAATGAVYRLERGIPTGSPIANVVANLYLAGLDAEVSVVAGAFYARYGDDMIAAHVDAGEACRLGRMLAAHLSPRGLEFNATKARDFHLNRGGVPGLAGPGFEPASAVEFLGHRVSAHGTISLSKRKTRTLLRDARTRAASGARAGGTDAESRVAGAVRATNHLLDPDRASAHPYARALRTAVTDRAFLQWLDHEIARLVLGAALGRTTAANFREYPPRALRDRFHLRSLVVARNRAGRGS